MCIILVQNILLEVSASFYCTINIYIYLYLFIFSVLYRFLHWARPVLWTPYFTQFSEWPGEICQSWNSEVERHVMIYVLWHEKWSWVKWQWVGLHNKPSNGLAPFFLWARMCQISVNRSYIIIHPYLTMQWICWHCAPLFKHCSVGYSTVDHFP